MAIFGVQVVISMIVARSFLHKIFPYYSFGRWLITSGLKQYQSPTVSLLRPHVSVPPSNNRGGGSNGGRKRAANQRTPTSEATAADILLNLKQFSSNRLDPSLAIPKSANIKLQDVPVHGRDSMPLLRFSEQLEWMINFTLTAVIVYAITLAYYYIVPSAVLTEYNLSTIWLLLVSCYLIKVLVSLTKVYYSEELASQRSVGIVFTMFFFVCALGILLIDEGVLDFGLERSHKSITVCC